MNGRELKQVWHSGVPSFGAAITCSDPAVAAAICNVGYEWVLIDAEHHPFSLEVVRNIIEFARGRGVVAIVRVPENNAAMIKQMLDLGAEGIMVPMLRTVEDAHRAAASCRYPPQGIRGFGPRDASNYYSDIDDYLKTFNDRVIVMLQVEQAEAADNIDGFLATPGVDSILIGPGDLSFSLGFPLQVDHPMVRNVIDTLIAKCRAAGVPVGSWPGGSAQDQVDWIRRGLDFLVLGTDCGWITEAAGGVLREVRQATGGR